MSRNWFDASCEECGKDIRVLIGDPPRCPRCSAAKETEVVDTGEGENAVIIKPGGEKEG